MTINIIVDHHIGETSEPQCHKWPAHIAMPMAEKICDDVRETLSNSRLVPNGSAVQLFEKHDILSVEKVLGSGSFSQVSSVFCKNGRRYACKHLHQRLMENPEQFMLAAKELSCEAHMLASFDHPNIIKIRGWSKNGIQAFAEGCNNSFFLLLDVLEDTLESRIDRWRFEHIAGFSDQTLYLQKLQIMSEISSALSYLHERCVIYRDLKPNNIGFLDGRVQLFDFGLSRELPAVDVNAPFRMSGKVGTLRYMANEVASNQPYNLSADVFSFAMVSYEMLSLQKPFDGWTREMHSRLACDQAIRPDFVNCASFVPLDMRMVLEQLWHPNPAQRPTIDQVMIQLGIFVENEFVAVESQKMQLQLAQQLHAEREFERQLEVERIARTEVAQILNLDMAIQASENLRKKLRRSLSNESIETIETTSLSMDSIGF